MVETPLGGRVALGRVCRSCEIEVEDRRLSCDFIVLDMHAFDVILCINWLTYYQAVINCYRRRVSVCMPSGKCFYFM